MASGAVRRTGALNYRILCESRSYLDARIRLDYGCRRHLSAAIRWATTLAERWHGFFLYPVPFYTWRVVDVRTGQTVFEIH